MHLFCLINPAYFQVLVPSSLSRSMGTRSHLAPFLARTKVPMDIGGSCELKLQFYYVSSDALMTGLYSLAQISVFHSRQRTPRSPFRSCVPMEISLKEKIGKKNPQGLLYKWITKRFQTITLGYEEPETEWLDNCLSTDALRRFSPASIHIKIETEHVKTVEHRVG